MAIAQKLYEAGKITCMRSDAVMVVPEAQVAARSWLTAAFGEGPCRPSRRATSRRKARRRRTRRSGLPTRRPAIWSPRKARRSAREEGVVRAGRCRPAAASRVAGRAAGRSNAGRCPAAMFSCVRRGPRAGAWRSRPGGVRRAGAAASGPDRRLGAVEPGGSTFALGACGWRREMRHFLEIFKQVQTAPLWCIFRPSGY